MIAGVVTAGVLAIAAAGASPQAQAESSTPEDCVVFVALLKQHIHYTGAGNQLPLLLENPAYEGHRRYLLTCNWAAAGWPTLRTERDAFAHRPYLQLGRPAYNWRHDAVAVDVFYMAGVLMARGEVCRLRRRRDGWRILGCHFGSIS